MPRSPLPARPPAASPPASPLLTVSGDRLIAVDRAPGPGARRPRGRKPSGRPHPFAPYARLFAVPGATAFTVWNLVARLPMGMFGVAAVMMIAGQRGSYALAGAVTATGLAATAVVAPLTARLVDRHGQARVVVPAASLAAAGSLALVLCVRQDAPAWTLFAAHAATATTPNTGGMARARWAHLLRDDPAARHTANSFEQAADELCFMLGPVLAALLCTALFPEAGTLTGAVLLITGTLLFAAQRRTEPPVAPRTAAGRRRSPALLPGMPPLLVTFLATGAVFGSLEVVTLAHADGLGHTSLGGAVLALQAAGSALAGLAFGALRPRGPVRRRFAGCVAAMAVLMTLPLAAAASGSLAVTAGALLLAGGATAPTMVTGMTLIQRRTPAERLNEGMTLAVTALLGGVAAGSAAGGWAVQQTGPEGGVAAAYGVPLAAAALAAACAAAGAGSRGGRDRTGSGGPGGRTGDSSGSAAGVRG
ncbi:MFS transporter [Streptomyces sp. JJ36]|uniref:MFS transporter n=1 Tax=Streptomyces sp. JJ36 TaxID=2736645 RepID=UPI001F32C3E9|nr:MFS transporter [Streptomyces sp. JJ36]MCF6525075.1 MFS transporter [Streptomyces sp. JJ36]